MLFNNKKFFSLSLIMHHLFQLLEVKVTDRVLRETIEEQGEFENSLQGIKDTLSKFDIESRIFRLDYSDLLSIECPLIAHIEEGGVKSFVVIKSCDEDTICYFDSIRGDINETITNFKRKWSGVILVPITNEQSGDPEYLQNLNKEKKENRLLYAYFFLIFIFFMAIMAKSLIDNQDFFLARAMIILCKIFGIVISTLIVKIELGKSDPIIRQICHNYECDKVLHSSASKLFSWLSMGDIGIIYFSSSFLLISLIQAPIQTIFTLIIALNIITLPYTLFSIFYQWKIAKTFCPFCCIIIILLWLEFAIVKFVGLRLSLINLDVIIITSIYLIMVIILWFLFKSFLVKSYSATQYKSIILKIKKDVEIFKSVLSTRPAVLELTIPNELVIGDINAIHTLIAILSTDCVSCFRLFSELKSYSQHFPQYLKIILRFQGSDSDIGSTNLVIDRIISMQLTGESQRAMELYESWNILRLKGIRKWEVANNLTNFDITNNAKQLRLRLIDWINTLNIHGTPVIIFDNKIVPDLYTFSDIKYFLNQLNEN